MAEINNSQTVTKDFFNYSPDLLDIINFAKFEKTIKIPSREEGSVKYITLTLLTEDEMLDVIKNSARRVDNPQDIFTRSDFMKLETLVYSISKINDEVFTSQDVNENTLMKRKLRKVLGESIPEIIDYLYEMYGIILDHKKKYVGELFAPLKKKVQTEVEEEIKPL